MLRLRPVAPLPEHAAGLGESADTARISDRRLQKYVAHDERVTERKIHGVVRLSLTGLLSEHGRRQLKTATGRKQGGGEERERQESAASGWAHRTVQLHTDSW